MGRDGPLNGDRDRLPRNRTVTFLKKSISQIGIMTNISILMYHQVGVFDRPAAHRSTYCHIRRFKAQMAYLKYLNYRVISADEAVAVVQGKQKLDGHAVVLTFDDGYADFLDTVWPILKRYRFPATVFMVSALAGKPSSWFEADGRETPPLLNVEQLRQLRRAGITIGAHTLSHPRLSRIPREQMTQEIVESRRQLTEMLEEDIPYFCYPYGDYDAAVVDAVKDAGFQAAFSCIRGAAVPGDDRFLLPRKAISYGDSLAGFWWKLHMKHAKKLPTTSASEKGCC